MEGDRARGFRLSRSLRPPVGLEMGRGTLVSTSPRRSAKKSSSAFVLTGCYSN